MTDAASLRRDVRGSPSEGIALRRAVLRWYLATRRDLPWRRTCDPYAIWVSEIMLQQTRAETVIPYFERFLGRFPTVHALAAAPERDVLAAWSGLGYYRRARNLHAAARGVVREHGGRLPRDPDALRRLPGVGEYTAAAIASVAFDVPAAAVDGNVTRVLARVRGLKGARDSAPLRRAVARFARALAEGPRPADWTQALMELGAVVCLPRAPRCDACPAAPACVARARGAPERYPSPARPPRPKSERRILLVARSGRRVLVVPGEGEARSGWGLPEARVPSAALRPASQVRHRGTDPGPGVALALARRYLGPPAAPAPAGRFAHRTYSHALTYEVWIADGSGKRPARGARWVAEGALEVLPLRSPSLKALRALSGSGGPRGMDRTKKRKTLTPAPRSRR